ncbi:hypothetical protein E2R25_16520 [Burkholderia pseudomallei]|nr:hypothetical protein EXY28_16530 [Burkholderia pseudomallei]QBP69853.1 hypothetical protein E2R25_16520 [Burkholderia pseudomallei]
MLVGRIMPTPDAEPTPTDADAEAQKRFAGLRYTGT